MKNDLAAGCPEGYRFLVQLVDCPDHAAAHQEINRLFGNRYSSLAKYVRGSARLVCLGSGDNGKYEQQETGFRVYVPKEFRL